MRERFYIRTYGCQMNERDSEALACLLEEHGFSRTGSEDAADIILFNTCSVRDQAERKVVGKVGLLKRLKRRKPDVIIGLMGCMAQNHGEAIVKRQPHVDLVVGPDHRGLTPVAAIAGATLVMGVDTLARTVVAPVELPVGAVLALLGGPFLIVLLRSRRAWSL